MACCVQINFAGRKKGEGIVMRKSKIFGRLLASVVLFCILAGTGQFALPVEAAQEDGAAQKEEAVQDTENTEDAQLPESGLILEAGRKVDMKAEPAKTAETLMTFKKGSLLFATGEAADGWYHVIYQGMEGYVEVQGLSALELDIEGLDAEMAANEAETKFVVEVVEKYRKDARRSKIWGTVIIVLVAGIFAVGIFSAVRSNKMDNGETDGDEGVAENKEKAGKKEKSRDNRRRRNLGKRKEQDLEIEDLNG